jgi:hypothetical protein
LKAGAAISKLLISLKPGDPRWRETRIVQKSAGVKKTGGRKK